MSEQKILTQGRPFKIEIYGLQDNYIGTLQPYEDTFIGCVINPIIEISGDGTQKFTCQIPKFFVNPKTNLKEINPRWEDAELGVLAENTRVLKVFIQKEPNKIEVLPFIIDSISDGREAHFSVYKEITANGLAFSDLGKQGYKLELTKFILSEEHEKDETLEPTINYWLDKVFPNEKKKDDDGNLILDENGEPIIAKWLTPWCYEIRMDWSNYSEIGRLSTKIYEDSYTSSWGLNDAKDKLESQEIVRYQEKARMLDIQESNKYNITQTIAETFGVFCRYEYKCNTRGEFIDTYTENGRLWRGKKVIFYNRAIKAETPLVLDYQKNLSTIKRTLETSDVYSKLYVTPISSDKMSNGYVTIADTSLNPLMDEFLLNFDYLYEKGAITPYQKRKVQEYQVSLHKINTSLAALSPQIESKTVDVNNQLSQIALVEKEIQSLQETLTQNETLRDNDLTNESVVKGPANSYSVVFIEENGYYSAKIKLEGVAASTVKGYDNYKYTKILFPTEEYPLQTVREKKIAEIENNVFYLLLNEYGYPIEIYTSLKNNIIASGTKIVYLSLTYSPYNAYETICARLQETLQRKAIFKKELEDNLEKLENKLKKYEDQYNNILQQKENLNLAFENLLGPALREGYWSPKDYEGSEQFIAENAQKNADGDIRFLYDSQLFEGEETGYIYSSATDNILSDKIYHPYIDIKEEFYSVWSQNIENLVLILRKDFTFTTTETQSISEGVYFIIYNNEYYYFKLPFVKENTTLTLIISDTLFIEIKEANGTIQTVPLFHENEFKEGNPLDSNIENAPNLTPLFEGINNYLGERKLYNNAGFIYSFISDNNEKPRPVLLLNDTEIDYNNYTKICYTFITDSLNAILTDLTISAAPELGYKLFYPRININKNNVNEKSDLLKIYVGSKEQTETNKLLEKFKDYLVFVRQGKSFITLKVTNQNTLEDIINGEYYVECRVSRANEMLYLDAKEVAKENSAPRYSYTISKANLPNENQDIDLGYLVYINDYALGVHAASGYVDKITYNLTSPQDDGVTVQNYKTKFEDLFSSITASTEAMKKNEHSYNIAANSFSPAGGIAADVLQYTLNNNELSFNFSSTNVSIEPNEGILLTNNQPYTNGVYGQVALRGGGVFLSNTVDSAGNRLWSTGITPNGINASLITTGQLDTNTIRIFANNNLAFQWNGEGIFAYSRNGNGRPILDKYIRYSDQGLQYIEGDHTTVDLGWNGLLISTQDGSTELTGNLGLTVYYGEKNEQGTNYAVRLGKFTKDEYGLRLYRKDNNNYIPTLITSNNGELWLQDSIKVGNADNGVGLSGADTSRFDDEGNVIYSPVRFWAGSADKDNAPFWVREDGSMRATQAVIEGTITAKNGAIGGWEISENSLSSGNMILSSTGETVGNENAPRRIVVTNDDGSVAFGVYNDGSFVANKAKITGEIYAEGGQIGSLTIAQLEEAFGQLTTEIISSLQELPRNEIFVNKLTVVVYEKGKPVDESFYDNYSYEWKVSKGNGEWQSLPTDYDKIIANDEEWDLTDENIKGSRATKSAYYIDSVNEEVILQCIMTHKNIGG